jgi:hypothetical protein
MAKKRVAWVWALALAAGAATWVVWSAQGTLPEPVDVPLGVPYARSRAEAPPPPAAAPPSGPTLAPSREPVRVAPPDAASAEDVDAGSDATEEQATAEVDDSWVRGELVRRLDALRRDPVRVRTGGASVVATPRLQRHTLHLAVASSALLMRVSFSPSEPTEAPADPRSTGVATLDDLEAWIDLDWRTRAAIARVVEDAVADLVRLRRSPDDAGRTWERAQADAVRWVNGARVVDDAEVDGWRDRLVRGGDDGETFGAAEQAILVAARDAIREAVGSAHHATFDTLDLTGLFGPFPPGNGQPSIAPGP